MCRVYRGSLGIVNPSSYESKYETESEHKYWENLYKVRGYGPYEGKGHFNGKPITRLVIPDPPEDWQQEWMAKNGHRLRDDDTESSASCIAITPEQEAKAQEFLKRMEAVCIKDESGEIIAITDGALLSEFQLWLSQENLSATDEMEQLVRESWVRIFSEEEKDVTAPPIREMGGPEPLPSPIPPLEKPQKTMWADLNESKPVQIPVPIQSTTEPRELKPVWSDEREGFVYV
jgi:hypothetical protein